MDLHPFRILSLCSGVGGIELGFKLAEPTARTICYVEIEAFACEILARRMEEKRLDQAPIWTNLKTFDGKPWRGVVDCITGGYPCQPFSVAGKKLGDKDPRHLWPEIKRLITEIEPPICFFENVGGHLRLGFEEVANDLQQLGYQVKAGLFTAAEVGAPHKRERLFILAYRSFNRCNSGGDNISKRYLPTNLERKLKKNQQEWQRRITRPWPSSENMADSSDIFCQWRERQRSGSGKSETEIGSDDSKLADCNSSRLQEARTKLKSARFARGESKMANSESSRTGKHERELRQGSEKHCGELGDTTSKRLEGWQCQESNTDQLYTWPPSPASYEQWERIPNHLKPALYRMADGLADRVDRIRACGNGVVPLVAAYAWRTLTNGMYLTKNKLENHG